MTSIMFVSADGRDQLKVDAPPGMTILQIAHFNDINIEGACGGHLACSTCHIILSEGDFQRLSPPHEEEEELLDLTIGACSTSRLCCQIVMDEALDGLVIRLPGMTSDQRS